jgi:hypothetical protein
MPACRSMIGLAADPGTAVLPICSISRTRWPSAARRPVVSSLAWAGRAESYGTTCDALVEGGRACGLAMDSPFIMVRFRDRGKSREYLPPPGRARSTSENPRIFAPQFVLSPHCTVE